MVTNYSQPNKGITSLKMPSKFDSMFSIKKNAYRSIDSKISKSEENMGQILRLTGFSSLIGLKGTLIACPWLTLPDVFCIFYLLYASQSNVSTLWQRHTPSSHRLIKVHRSDQQHTTTVRGASIRKCSKNNEFKLSQHNRIEKRLR